MKIVENANNNFIIMKNLKLILASSFFFIASGIHAQSSFVENAAKSIFTLTTFKSDGSILASSHGIFIGTNGEAVADWKSFLGAKTAVVVDAEGRAGHRDQQERSARHTRRAAGADRRDNREQQRRRHIDLDAQRICSCQRQHRDRDRRARHVDGRAERDRD